MVINNTFLTDLKPNDKIVEHHRSGQRYISEVKSIDEDRIIVSRRDGGKYISIPYETKSGRIINHNQVSDFWLQPYYPLGGASPFKPGAVSSDAEPLIPPYGLDT